MMPADPIVLELSSLQRKALLVGGIASVLAVVALFLDREQFLRSYLFAYLYWTGMALGCLGILLLHHVVGGKWGMMIRRACEAGARTMLLMAVLFLPVLIGMKALYPWTRPEAAKDANIQAKAAYLNVPFFTARAVFFFAVWVAFAYLLSRWSREQDRTSNRWLIDRMRRFSAPGLVVLTLTATFAFVDWIMSLEPHWYSTIYGAMFMIGQMLGSFAFVIALVIVLSKSPVFRDRITEQHIHDLGNLMFAFMVLWAYLSFSQFLIIWAGNLPQEIPWYVARLNGGWGKVAGLIVIFHFAVPFVLLLMRGIKRRAERLLRVCLLLLVIRIVDVYWIVEPSFYGQRIQIHWQDLVMPVAIGGLWLTAFFWQLKDRPLVPVGDPRLEGPPRETVAF
jgi:hypothetical protein